MKAHLADVSDACKVGLANAAAGKTRVKDQARRNAVTLIRCRGVGAIGPATWLYPSALVGVYVIIAAIFWWG